MNSKLHYGPSENSPWTPLMQRIVDNTQVPDRVAIYPVVRAYCDGGVYGASRSDVAASWAYRIVDEGGKVIAEASGVLLPNALVDTLTNNYAEYVAAVRALEACPVGHRVILCSDSLITIRRLLDGWATNGLPEKLVRRGNKAVGRLSAVSDELHDGHPTALHLAQGYGKRGNPVSIHQQWCDRECTRVLHMPEVIRARGTEKG